MWKLSVWAAGLHGGARGCSGTRGAERGGRAEPPPHSVPGSPGRAGFLGEGRTGRAVWAYPVIIEFAGDHGRSQGARRVHGAAGVVDLQRGRGGEGREGGQGGLARPASAWPQPKGSPRR